MRPDEDATRGISCYLAKPRGSRHNTGHCSIKKTLSAEIGDGPVLPLVPLIEMRDDACSSSGSSKIERNEGNLVILMPSREQIDSTKQPLVGF